ncbi:MAG: response regulator [candidate division Zixibacteria bacterium]|nr:response regulator [candidate division Zixibacteria bacterium]MDH3938774.1 response regulator [candidate division Zixibacteria bacterium]MDH4034006.1 response regulator [candidate division Zixibacteria bacterium]
MARILIVDDSEVIRELLTEYLSEQGHQVDSAVDGQYGIEQALDGDFDIILCDLHMPRKNGYQVFTEVTAARPSSRFIMTDSLPDELARLAQEAGAYGCLTKPFDLEEVTRTVEEVLSKALSL